MLTQFNNKVIDPLLLDELREMLNEAEAYKNEKTRNEKLREFQNYIASLNFFATFNHI